MGPWGATNRGSGLDPPRGSWGHLWHREGLDLLLLEPQGGGFVCADKEQEEGKEVEALRGGKKVDHVALKRNKWREQGWEEMETLNRMERSD